MNVAYNMDCVVGMKNLSDDTIDLTVTSPPYDSIRTYNGFTFDYERTLEQLFRVTKPGGVVVWIVSDQTKNGSESGTSFRQALFAMDCGFNLHDTMIWNKQTCAFPETTRYYPVFDYMFVFSKGKPKTSNLIADKPNTWSKSKITGTGRQTDGSTKKLSGAVQGRSIKEFGVRGNVWEISSEKHNTTGHPAVFPMQLVVDHIISWSNEGDTVLDPFLGSGTTRIAAYDLNRNFIGYEISKEYFDKQEERFANHTSQMNLFLEET